MENTLIVLVTALAFLAGVLTATMATTWWARNRYSEVRRGTACGRPGTCCRTATRW
ncbi:hypothetical protein [Amycolatopsis balhimycina]|uniref:hypothetical protein n=1 Tax=Amycolatopsis balhimycina TaxID=208443 RepID=UPI000373DC7E|nr:hypothetical protein [Amycolatopsis balhimycina]